jgi:hypothetical protein
MICAEFGRNEKSSSKEIEFIWEFVKMNFITTRETSQRKVKSKKEK